MEKDKKVRYVTNKYQMEMVLQSRKLSSGSKLVLLNLRKWLGGKNYCWPSQTTIGKELGLSSRMIRNHIKVLEKAGIIQVSRGAYSPKLGKSVSSNRYDLSKILQKKAINGKDEEI